jgi:Rha family phage regulatory protein
MKNQLVFTKNNEVWSDSLIFAKNFGISHRHLMEKIRNLTVEISAVKNIFIEVNHTTKRNRIYKKYLMNRDGYMFLVMNVGTKKANEIKLEFVKAFNSMERALLNHQNASWLESRTLGKISRKTEADVIKEFVDYATKQGSTKPQYYYPNITKMSYKALELLDSNKTTPIRDMISGAELWNLRLAELKVAESLKKGMEQGLHYKEIYILAKQELTELFEFLPKPKLLDTKLN